MILNNIRFQKNEDSRNRLHGLTMTRIQLQVLQVWQEFMKTHYYPPSLRELGNLTKTAPSQMSEWFNLWFDQKLISRSKGFRKHEITPKGEQLINDLTELDNLWTEYVDKRNALIRRFNTPDTGATPDFGLRRQDTRYEEPYTD